MSEARIGIRTDTKEPEAAVKSVKGLFQDLGAEAKKSVLTGVGLAGGVAAFSLLQNAAGAAVNYLGNAVQAASALNESQSKAEVVFGDSAAEIKKWAATASTSMGMSTQAALEAAGTYGNLFQAFGLGRDEATKMSKTLVGLATDLASFNNTSVDDALVALRSGLSGETEPLKRYGIAISDARMRTELMAQGVTNLGATLTPLQKTQAAYALILKDSTLAQGDFGRTSDGLANTQRSLDATLADLSAEIGQSLMPVMASLAKVARDTLVPALRDLVKLIKDAGPVWDVLGAAIGQLTGGPMRDFTDAIRRQAEDAAEGYSRMGEESRGWVNDTHQAMLDAGAVVEEGGGHMVDVIRKVPGLMADALLAEQQKLADPIKQLLDFMKAALTPAQEIARAKGFLASAEYAAGLASNNPLVVQKTQELGNAALVVLGSTAGVWSAGNTIGTTWINAIVAAIKAGKADMITAVTGIRNIIGHSLPTEGPLKGDAAAKGGFSIGELWGRTLGKTALASLVDEFRGMKLPSLAAMAGGGGGTASRGSGLALAGAAGERFAGEIHIHIDQGAYIDGPSIDLLTNKIAQRLRTATGI